MVPLLALLSTLAGTAPPERVAATAEVRIVVLRAHRASSESWSPEKARNQREIHKQEKDGTHVRLRLTEFE